MKNLKEFKNKLTKPEMNKIRGGDGEVEVEEIILTPDELSTILKKVDEAAMAITRNLL